MEFDLDLVEKVARALCETDGVDADQVGGVWDGGCLPRNDPAWTAWVGSAETAIAIVKKDEAEVGDGKDR